MSNRKMLHVHNLNPTALRSHQWKYDLNPYSSCSLGCVYCCAGGYRRQLPFSPEDLLDRLEKELSELPRKYIIYLSPAADPYPAEETRIQLMPRILKLLLQYDLPVVILTKSLLILRDRDLLTDLHARNRLLVQFSLLTIREPHSRRMEGCTAAPPARLAAARQLSSAGIPIHFHVSPYIPGFYREGELEETIRAIADHGGRCIYTNLLGITAENLRPVVQALRETGSPVDILDYYLRFGWRSKVAWLPRHDLLAGDMEFFAGRCRAVGLSFVCEFLPHFSCIRKEDFSCGIFLSGQPAVYQMMDFWTDKGDEPVGWESFQSSYLATFPLVDPEYRLYVKALWDKKVLFENTRLVPERIHGKIHYRRVRKLQLRKPNRLRHLISLGVDRIKLHGSSIFAGETNPAQ